MPFNNDPGDNYKSSIGQTQSNGYDVVTGPVAQASGAVRAAFLQKVYLTLFAGITISMGTAFMVMDAILKGGHSEVLGAVLAHPFIIMLLYIGMAVLAGSVSRVKGVNIIVYLAFTAVTGLLLSFPFLYAYAATHSYEVIWNALWITGAVFAGLSGYVFVTGQDFSFMGGFLWTGLFVLLGFMVATFFFHAPAFTMAVTVGGILLFALFVLYDTSLVMRRLGPNEWVAGALCLFLDFINLFIRILRILSRRN